MAGTAPSLWQRSNARAVPVRAASYLTHFDPDYAPVIARWAVSEQELLWLAPSTPPPLTADKVARWARPEANRLLYWRASHAEPLGYAELNPMLRNPGQMWIGHFVVAPAARGRGVGRSLARSVLWQAFEMFAATRVLLVVFPDNQAAIACYRRAGMQVDGREQKYCARRKAQFEFIRMGIDRRQFRTGGDQAAPVMLRSRNHLGRRFAHPSGV